jgi:nucleotidyltransferase/DNA polymerase involved in DNA repair
MFRARVAAVLRRFSPTVEQSSLDDLYADLTGTPALRAAGGGARASRRAIKEIVRGETGLSVSRGIARARRSRAWRRGTAAGRHRGDRARRRARDSSRRTRFCDLRASVPRRWRCSRRLEPAHGRRPRALDPRVLEKALGRAGLVLARRARGDDDEPCG